MANGKSLKSKKKIFIFSGIGAVILVLVLIVLTFNILSRFIGRPQI